MDIKTFLRIGVVEELYYTPCVKPVFIGCMELCSQDALNLHKKFIDECYSRLEAAMIPLGASALSQVLSAATAIVTSICVSGQAILPSPSRYSLHNTLTGPISQPHVVVQLGCLVFNLVHNFRKVTMFTYVFILFTCTMILLRMLCEKLCDLF